MRIAVAVEMPKAYKKQARVKLTAKRLESAKPIKRNVSEAHRNLSEFIKK